MKNNILYITGLLVLFMASCSKDNDENTGPGNNNDPDPVEKTVKYRGTLVTDDDESGFFWLELKEKESVARVTIAAKVYTLNGSADLTGGEAIEDFVLSDGTNTLTVSADKDWKSLEAAFGFAGKSIDPIIYEETEQQQVENYTGWSKSTNGTETADYVYVLSIRGDQFTSKEKLTGGSGLDASTISGTVERSTGKITFSFEDDGDPVRLTLNVSPDGNTLSYSEEGPDNYSLEIELKKIP